MEDWKWRSLLCGGITDIVHIANRDTMQIANCQNGFVVQKLGELAQICLRY